MSFILSYINTHTCGCGFGFGGAVSLVAVKGAVAVSVRREYDAVAVAGMIQKLTTVSQRLLLRFKLEKQCGCECGCDSKYN